MRPTTLSTLLIWSILALFDLNMAQNPFYGNQTPPPNDQNYDRYNTDPNNRYNNDPYNRYNDSNRYNDPNNRFNDSRYNNDPNNRYNDPYNRNNDSKYNDPNNRYNSDNRYNNDNRYNDPSNRYNSTYPPYNLGSDLNPNYRNGSGNYNPYNQDPNNRYNNRNNDPNNRYNDPNNRYNDPNNRYNDPNNRYNDPNNRYNDPNNRYNDPNNRNNDPNNRYNDPNNRYNDPNNRYNDPNNRYNDPSNRYNQPNQNNNQNNRYDPYNQGSNNTFNQYNQQGRFESGFGGSQSAQNDPNDNCCEDYCYRMDENPYVRFASKTAYELSHGGRAIQDVSECTPVQMWSINRHGTRLPTEQEIRRLKDLNNLKEEILKNYDERRSFPYKGRLCNQDLDLLRRWRWNDTLSDNRQKVLTSQGIEDARFLARRFKSRYGNLLNQPYKENYYNFQYDQSDYKTHDTYQAYIEGLFDLSKSFNVHANTDTTERILPPAYCKTWSREVENNNYTYNEYERFKQRQEYLQMVRDIFKRLGFRYTLNEVIVRDMYDMCRYEKAWYLTQPSPWCSVFTKSQLEMLEYAEDLQDYYHSGYGSPENTKVGCLLVKDMYEIMKKMVNGEPAETYKVSHYFTQSTQFLRFLTALGVARDNSPLTADNYYQQKNRQWKLSTIDPFGANLMAVLYNCQRENKFKVMLLLNEVPVNFPECSVGLCDWNTFEQKIRTTVDNCNRDYCERGSSNSVVALGLLPVIISSLIISLLL